MLRLLTFTCVFFIAASGQIYNLAGLFEEEESEFNQKAFQLAVDLINSKRKEFELKTIINDLPVQEPFPAIKTTCEVLKSAVIGIFGPKSLNNINAVQSVCDEKEMPHILTRWMYYPLRPGSAINFYPYAPLLTKAYWDIIQEWQWKAFTVLYEDDESLLRLSELIVLAKEEGIVVTVEQLDREGTGNYRDALKRVWKTKQKFLIIDCQINNLVDVLTQCQQIGLMTSDYSYFLTNLDAHTRDLSPFQWSQTNITGIRLINPENPYVQSISSQLFPEVDPTDEMVQIASRLETETALIFDAVNMFSETLRKLALYEDPPSLDCGQSTSWEFGYSLVNLLKTSSYKGLTGNIEFNNEGHRSMFGLQVYEIREGGIITVATYNSTLGLNVTRLHHESVIDDPDSMKNKTFVVIISLTEPYGMLKQSSENLVGNERYEGFSIDLIHELSLLEGFNYTFIVQHDGKNGNKVNGRWTGMIGAVIDGTYDLLGENFRAILAENFQWDKDQCPSLEECCVLIIAKHFKNHPILEELPCWNRFQLLDILPLDLPLDQVIPLIDEEHYWKRRYLEVFKYSWRTKPANWTWKSQYLERHCQKLVEEAQPQYNDEESFDDILALCNPYVKRLFVEQLQLWKPPLIMEKEDIPEVWPIDHINFLPIFKKLNYLEEFDLVFGMNNIGEDFKWQMFEVTLADCQKLGKAIQELPHLRILRVHKSNIGDKECKALIKGVMKCTKLEVLDLSHCKIADNGALYVAHLLVQGTNLKVLNLSNNNIGKIGAEGLGFALLQRNCDSLMELNLKLNPLHNEGVMGIFRAIVRCSIPKNLSIAGCLFGDDTPLKVCQMLKLNETLKRLDVSSNFFGAAIGDTLVESVKENTCIEFLDLRETDISAEHLEQINAYLVRNRAGAMLGAKSNLHEIEVEQFNIPLE